MAISPQLQKYIPELINKYKLSFNMLRDEGNRVASKFGIVWTLPGDLQELYRKFSIDLERFNGDTSWTLPMPGRFIIDRQGIIRSVDVHPDYTNRPEPEETIKILESL